MHRLKYICRRFLGYLIRATYFTVHMKVQRCILAGDDESYERIWKKLNVNQRSSGYHFKLGYDQFVSGQKFFNKITRKVVTNVLCEGVDRT